MQPVVEFTQSRPRWFSYAVRAPRSNGKVPPHSYRSDSFPSLSACLIDAARGLTPQFKRVYVRYQGICVGERELIDMYRHPEAVANEMLARYEQDLSSA